MKSILRILSVAGLLLVFSGNGAEPNPSTFRAPTSAEIKGFIATNNAAGINVRWFGAKGDGTNNDTVPIQAAIDAAIDAKTSVYFPPGIYILSPWGDAEHVLLCGYSTVSGGHGITSATHPSDPRQDFPQFGSLLLAGVDTGKRLNRIDTTPNETFTKGAVLKFTGRMANHIGIATGFLQRNIRLKNLTLIGTGYDVESIGVRHNVSSSHFELENCSFWHWGIAVDIGGDFLARGDTHADFNTLRRVSIDSVGIGVKIGGKNAYVTSIEDCEISARICVQNKLGSDGGGPSPKVNIYGGFLAPLTEFGGVLFTGAVAGVRANAIRVGPVTRTSKVRNSSFTLAVKKDSAPFSDVTKDMLVIVEGNCAGLQGTHPPHWGVLGEIASLGESPAEIRFSQRLPEQNLVGKTVYIFRPAVALDGDNFNVFGAHFEATEAEDLGFGPMLARLKGWHSTTHLSGIIANFQGADSGFNRALPKIWHQGVSTNDAFPIAVERSILNFCWPKFEVSPAFGVLFRENVWMCEPLFIDHEGAPARGVVRENESAAVKFASNAGDLKNPEWTHDNFLADSQGARELIDGAWRRLFPVTSAKPPRGTAGEIFINSNDAARPLFYRIARIRGLDGCYDGASVDCDASIDVNVDAGKAAVTSLSDLSIGRVILIPGAGKGGSNLLTRIIDLALDSNRKRFAWIAPAASTSVTGVKVSPVAPVIEGFSRQSDFAAAPPKSGTYRANDIVWAENPVAGGRLGWICTASGSPGQWAEFGYIGNAHTFGEPNATSPVATFLGGASGADLVEWKRIQDGTTNSFTARVGAGEMTIRDKIARRDLATFTSESKSIALRLSGGISLPIVPEPAVPSTNHAELFFENVGGKMALRVRFPTGPSQTIATEP